MLNGSVGELVEVNGRPRLRTKPGLSGHAVFGPYAELEAGKYRVEFSIKPLAPLDEKRDPLIAVADVAAGVVVILFDALVFRSQLEDDERYVAYFETDRPLSGVEYRLYVNGAEPLLIGGEPRAVEVERLEPSAQPIPPLALLREHADHVRSLFFAGAAVVVRGRDLVVTLAGQSFLVNTPQDLTALARLALAGRPALEPPREDGHTAALVIALGAHAPFGETGYALVGHVMDVVYGGHRRAHCASLAELRIHWSEHKGRPILLTADRPDTALSDLLTKSDFPILVFCDDPADAVVYRAAVENQPLRDAIRFCSQSFSCLIGCTASEQVRIFDSRHYASRLSEMVEGILAALGIAPDAALAARAVQRIAAVEGVAAEAIVEDLVRRRGGGETMASLAAGRFDAAARALIGSFAANYGPFLTGRESDTVEWPLELFYVDASGETGDRYVDLIGGARIIFFGPYLHLPLGGWRALVQFEVADNASGNEIEADVWAVSAQTTIAKCQAKLPAQGYFQFTLDFVNTDPNAVLEIRVRLVKGAIEGRFGVRRVTLFSLAKLEDLVGGAAARRLRSLQESPP